MILDLSAILAVSGEGLSFSKTLAPEEFNHEQAPYKVIAPVEISGNITNIGDAFQLKLTGSASIGTTCARCAKEIERDISFSLDETISTAEENLDNVTLKGNFLDITDIIYSSFLASIEYKYLCREDCLGLCPVCGVNLNEQTCDCSEDTIDPRLEVLRHLFDNND